MNALQKTYQGLLWFKNLLQKKGPRYEKKYGCQPFFKAGVHAGIVTVTEVGKYKKEITYHRDVINTAARIQGKSNAFERELLISKELKTQLNSNTYSYAHMGSIPLKGKRQTVAICSVSPKTQLESAS
ncbi:hypothetical protein L0P88_14020 [Muricauda sp. SCSIO 64092]|uniref:adenylate/guanylate cyclase domain-containing protein n=1 Tax=Allomuricauda sp. SCSIO 64092 TaxID=2908842 RepID=UPI001FF3503B|nr:adenylate/guanylate cyclase domain-containing protein [Muricauda sp. SCSIO 64092]UOY05067.1 hypothetical protein L0P88_14020 [Muricauda sp. SCSIO 64092]